MLASPLAASFTHFLLFYLELDYNFSPVLIELLAGGFAELKSVPGRPIPEALCAFCTASSKEDSTLRCETAYSLVKALFEAGRRLGYFYSSGVLRGFSSP